MVMFAAIMTTIVMSLTCNKKKKTFLVYCKGVRSVLV